LWWASGLRMPPASCHSSRRCEGPGEGLMLFGPGRHSSGTDQTREVLINDATLGLVCDLAPDAYIPRHAAVKNVAPMFISAQAALVQPCCYV
jgi:hypothetical protein